MGYLIVGLREVQYGKFRLDVVVSCNQNIIYLVTSKWELQECADIKIMVEFEKDVMFIYAVSDLIGCILSVLKLCRLCG